MRFFVVDVSQKFLGECRSIFKETPASGESHWAILNMHAGSIRQCFPLTTVIVYPAPGPPQVFFDGVGHTITAPLDFIDTFTSFGLVLQMLHCLTQVRTIDIVAVLPFGPRTRFTAQQMHDAFLYQKQCLLP